MFVDSNGAKPKISMPSAALGYGRFMQPDPIGYGDGLNWYNYVGSDPVNGVDPSGTELNDIVVTGHRNACADGWTCYSPGSISSLPSINIPSTGQDNAGGDVAGDPGDIVVTATRPKPKAPPSGTPHQYVIKFYNPCPASSVFNYFKQPGNSAPGAPAAREGFTPRINLFGVTGPNPISQYVNSSSGTIINTTLPGHLFYPGTVTIQVTPLSNQTSTTTITGVGTGADPKFNDEFGVYWFGNQAANAQNVCGR